MKKLLRQQLRRMVTGAIGPSLASNRSLLLNGLIAARQVRQIEKVRRLSDIEFGVFSQWGEDGILDWLVHHYGDMPRSFVEFGVENYVESNTRFLLQARNWKGLVIDGSDENIDFIRNDDVSWKHDLISVSKFITRENIDSIISGSGFTGDIGILSVDIDGNDYWVWDAISCVNPCIVIAEYNSTFGDIFPITIPYASDFVRSNAHKSNMYYGASIRALEQLARSRGYELVGCNGAGSNAFFVRQDRAAQFFDRIEDVRVYPALIRESRGESGEMTFVAPKDRASEIGACLVQNILTGDISPLADIGEIASNEWKDFYSGKMI